MVPSDMRTGGNVIALLAGTMVVMGVACSSSNHIASDGGTTTGSCSSPPKVEDTSLQECSSCTSMAMCTASTPVEACCTWIGEPNAALAPATNLHRYSAPAGTTKPELGCLTTPKTLGTPSMVTLTGYVWIFSNGVTDSSGNPSSSNVKVEVFEEDLTKGDGSISATPIGSYTTKPSDKADPVDTTWLKNCSQGCNLRQYTIPMIKTETPLVIKTSDASGGTDWATVYDYNVYFSNEQVQAGFPNVSNCPAGDACYDATAAAASDLGTVAGVLGVSINGSDGLLAGEVHDCNDVRLSGATVNTDVRAETQVSYFTSDEGNPLPYTQATVTSDLGLFGAINYPTGMPVRVTAVGQDPANAGKFLMLGTYVVQMYPGAVTAIALRGRRPWQH